MAEKVEFGDGYVFPKEVHNMLVGAQSAHIQLTSIADSKAGILMGASFVVFSLTVGNLGTPTLSFPLLVLAAFSFTAALLSVLAILPSIKIRSQVRAPNWLFFGAFSRLGEDEFVDKLVGAMRSEEQVYRIMARDLYQNGMVLQRRKYRYLGLAYLTFLAGMIGTLVAFLAQRLLG